MTGPVLPGSTVGVIGGGQLGRMFTLEARRMGYRVLVLDPGEAAPAAQVADGQIRAPLDDPAAVLKLAESCAVVTLEWENADPAAIRAAAHAAPIRPGPHVLEVAQHRVREKERVRQLGIRTAEFRAVRTRDELTAAAGELGLPAVLKTSRGGYDGRGQRVVREQGELAPAYQELGGDGEADLILERLVPFRMEASTICARNVAGQIASGPLAENGHREGILDFTIAPARLDPAVARQATEIGVAIAEGLDVVVVIAVELFIDSDDRIYVNELAPRPHNSGHYTWEACSVSQFEQQLRAVCGLPLERPSLLGPAAMANLLGQDIGTGSGLGAVADALAVPGLRLHLYGKAEARPGRKMGHLTVLADDPDRALSLARAAKTALSAGFSGVG